MAEIRTESGTISLSELRGRRIGRILTKLGKVTRSQVQEALDLQKNRRLPLGQLLVELGHCNLDDVNQALAAQAGMEMIDIEELDIAKEVLQLIPAEMAMASQILPITYDEATNTLTVALKSADNYQALDTLRLLMGFRVNAMVAPASQLDKKIADYYDENSESITSLIAEMMEEDRFRNMGDTSASVDLTELVEMADDNKIKRLLNLILLQAIKEKAADIHIEPFEDELKLRYRIDGVLYEMVPPPRYLAVPLISRIKVMANLDIAERRLPQDGRIELVVSNQPVDLRVAVLPTMFGESAVMRILDRSSVSLSLDKVGMRPDESATFRQLIRKPNGIVIVTGPTGSGKTTTLYSALNELNRVSTKLLTAEDPVEYDIEGMCQVQVNPAVGLTFAKALRSFLRQDPDIIFVGETRDIETGRIGVEAALTGHLVFTTLHTNDAPSTFARLLDMGLENFLITATVEGILAQRLVRTVCNRCKEAYRPTEDDLMRLALIPDEARNRDLFRGKGCEFCNGTGHKGRRGIFEILVPDDEIRDMVMREASSHEIMLAARQRGMRTLRESALLALYEGATSIDEVVIETVPDEI